MGRTIIGELRMFRLLVFFAFRFAFCDCPYKGCNCTENPETKIPIWKISCNSIPVHVPTNHKDTKILQIIGAKNLTTLSRNSFTNFSDLKELELYNGNIENIEDGAFSMLTELERLNLSANHLSESHIRYKSIIDRCKSIIDFY